MKLSIIVCVSSLIVLSGCASNSALQVQLQKAEDVQRHMGQQIDMLQAEALHLQESVREKTTCERTLAKMRELQGTASDVVNSVLQDAGNVYDHAADWAKEELKNTIK